MSEKPMNPRLVLLASIFPAVGHVTLGMPFRGLKFLFFIIVLGWLSHKFAAPTADFFLKNAGGIFVWGLSILDAYKIAKLRRVSKF